MPAHIRSQEKYPTTAQNSSPYNFLITNTKLSSLLHLNYHLILKLIEAEFSPPTFLSAAHFCSLLINFSYHNITSHSLNSCSFSVVYFHFPFIFLLCDIISFSKYVQHVCISKWAYTKYKKNLESVKNGKWRKEIKQQRKKREVQRENKKKNE